MHICEGLLKTDWLKWMLRNLYVSTNVIWYNEGAVVAMMKLKHKL